MPCIVLLVCDEIHTPVCDRFCSLPNLIFAHFWAKPLPPLWLSEHLPYHQFYNIPLCGSMTPCRKEEKWTQRLDFVHSISVVESAWWVQCPFPALITQAVSELHRQTTEILINLDYTTGDIIIERGQGSVKKSGQINIPVCRLF